MEYVDGGDLLNFVRGKAEGKLNEEDARWYFEQIVSVLDYLHQRRIVHRYDILLCTAPGYRCY